MASPSLVLSGFVTMSTQIASCNACTEAIIVVNKANLLENTHNLLLLAATHSYGHAADLDVCIHGTMP